MNPLEEQIKAADQICTEAYPYFERAVAIKDDAMVRAAKEKKTKKFITAGIAIACYVGGAYLNVMIPGGALIGLIAAIVLPIFYYKRVALAGIKAGLDEADLRAESEKAKGVQMLDDNADMLSIIPSDYWYPLATNYLLKIVQTGRATNVNQALMMLDEQLHRWKVEEANKAILVQQQTQTAMLKGIRRNTAVSAAANVVSAASTIARWF